MFRAALFLAALFLATLALARPVDAQLRTFCNSPTMDYCWSFLTYDIVHNDETSEWTSTIELFGSGYEAAGSIFAGGGTYARRSPECSIALAGHFEVAGPGEYTVLFDRSGGCGSDGPFPPNTLDDLEYVIFRFGEIEDWEGCYLAGPTLPCYEPESEPVSVPEPGTLLLLATGLVGITAAARRRRHVS